MVKTLTSAEDLLAITGGYRRACVLVAGAELGLFDALRQAPLSAEGLAERLRADLRATTMLADALGAMEVLVKEDGRYALAPGSGEFLTETGAHSVLAMLQHHANCLRNWAQLAKVVKTGQQAEREASIRGSEADLASFIEAMNDINRTMAPDLVKAIGPPAFGHLLDLGGGPATWTIAFLQANNEGKATLFDRPQVIPIAQRHVAEAGLAERVTLVGGDYSADEALPTGADLVWMSAIIHQNSREENRTLFAKAHAALTAGGCVLIRDVIMEEERLSPVDGALFAINMLVNTPQGGTYTFDEVREDLEAAGFGEVTFVRRGEHMDSVVGAVKV